MLKNFVWIAMQAEGTTLGAGAHFLPPTVSHSIVFCISILLLSTLGNA